jgi:hypothetical protein
MTGCHACAQVTGGCYLHGIAGIYVSDQHGTRKVAAPAIADLGNGQRVYYFAPIVPVPK